MSGSIFSMRSRVVVALVILLFVPGLASSLHGGIGGAQDNAGEAIGDVAKEGCLCHNSAADNTVQIILDDVPYGWIGGESYTLKLQIIGGPAASGAYTAGFSMRTTAGVLSGDGVQNWNDDTTTLTHTVASAGEAERMWTLTWQAPESGSGNVDFWITGNSVNGDQLNNAGGEEDHWNQLLFSLQEGSDSTTALGTRTLFAGDGNVSPPEPDHHGVDLHHMGAKLRAHWLGLLGFGAVILVIVFAGLMLRYGFSTSYTGRTNQLRLRYKLMRRGDQ
ncbi:MAG TPA: choice-of-anchor V domain-containing protein [Candidatus Poseidoniaceae archaeon]|nr:choice-of-anchor V domain-containing protein [Candidatus Poseidoniaceae archaeon]